MRRRDWLLLGVDLVKPERDLILAYDDPLGVTAAFNKNLLLRLNAEAGTNFDWTEFQARGSMESERVEGRDAPREPAASERRRSRAGGPLEFTLEPGESIWTESSYKYEPDGVRALVEPAGSRCAAVDRRRRRAFCWRFSRR